MNINSNTETKKYMVTPVKNRFVPDILKNDRIEEPGIYELNQREVRRAMHYAYLSEDTSSSDDDITIPDKIPDNPDNYFIMYAGKLGVSKIYPGPLPEGMEV